MPSDGKNLLLNSKRLTVVFFTAIALICIFYAAENKWANNNWKTIITSDGSGYYAYLPSIFIYHSFDFNKLEQLDRGTLASCNTVNGKLVDKYFVGVAILLTPFFLLAYFLSYLFGYSADGYSLLFQFGAAAGGLFYLLLGLVFTRKILLEFKIRPTIAFITLTLVLFGSNLFYYATIEPTMSHVYSFALAALFIYYVNKFIAEQRTRDLTKLILSFTILILVRPSNILFLALIPFISGGYSGLMQFVKGIFKLKRIALLLAIPIMLLGMQLIVWHAETGSCFLDSYSTEKFYLFRPHFFGMLFSFRKGWFIYTPLMFIAATGGLAALFKQDKFRFFTFFLFFLPFTYLLSCWWCWYYGDSFGMRIFIDCYALFALLLALFLNRIPVTRVSAVIGVILVLPLIYLNGVQQYQYINLIMSRDSMSKGRYWKAFLKTDDKYKGMFYKTSLDDLEYFPGLSYSNDFERDAWNAPGNLTTDYAHTGKSSAFVDGQKAYGPTLILKASDLPLGDDLYAHFDLWIFSKDTNNQACMVMNSLEPNGISDGWVSVPLKNRTASMWEHTQLTEQLPPTKTPENSVRIFLYSGGGGPVYADDLIIKLGKPR